MRQKDGTFEPLELFSLWSLVLWNLLAQMQRRENDSATFEKMQQVKKSLEDAQKLLSVLQRVSTPACLFATLSQDKPSLWSMGTGPVVPVPL